MRITTLMLHNSATKAGVTINHSLLNYIGSSVSQSSSLTSTLLNAGAASDTHLSAKSSYDEICDELEELLGYIPIFGAEGEAETVFDKARESGDTVSVCEAVKKMVESYNKALKAAGKVSSTDSLTGLYAELMKKTVTDKKEKLESAGLNLMSDGTIKIDEEKLKTQNVDMLESIFGGEDSIIKRMAVVAEKMADNAKSNSEYLGSSGYDINGKLYTYGSGKYDFIG